MRRAGVAFVCVSHIGVATVLGPVDAILDAERAATPVHIESPSPAECPSHHGHLFCQLVRSLSAAGVARSITEAERAEPVVRHVCPGCESSHVASAPITSGPVIPRGPPPFGRPWSDRA